MKKIVRKTYLEKLIKASGTPDIKVITGIRRSGKSYLLAAMREYFLSQKEDVNIIYLDFNLGKNEDLLEYHALHTYVESKYQPNTKNILMIDEVQMCSGFERAINSLHASEKYDIYITGSNAFLLSSDLATLFTGRTFEVEVFPFSFAEFSEYFELTDKDEAFERYTLEGGMAGSYVYEDIEDKYRYINNVYDTLIVRDINNRYDVRNLTLMDNLSDFMMDNISNQTSIRNISNKISENNTDGADKTVGNYLRYLMEAFAFYQVRRYDVKGKKYLQSQDKYYLADHAFRFARLGRKSLDYGRVYENIVAIELLRRGYEVYVGAMFDKEIDFVAIKQGVKFYIQVADNIDNPETFARETSSLLEIRDAYPKIILARTHHDPYQHEGIAIIDLPSWLKSQPGSRTNEPKPPTPQNPKKSKNAE